METMLTYNTNSKTGPVCGGRAQEKADNLEPDVAAKFLELPIPKAIVEEWEKVK